LGCWPFGVLPYALVAGGVRDLLRVVGSGLRLGRLVAGHLCLVGGGLGCVSDIWGMCAVGGVFGLVCMLGYLWPLVFGLRFGVGNIAVSWCLPESMGLWAVLFGTLLCQGCVRPHHCCSCYHLR
jgi:hypothetical protein